MPQANVYFPGSLYSADDAKEAMRQFAAVAASHGMVNRFGNGDIRQLIDSIATGELATVLLADEPRMAAIERLRELAPEQESLATREAFESIAAQLERAVQREG